MSNPFINAAAPTGKFAKFNQPGDSITIQVTDKWSERQHRTFGTNEPAFYPKSGDPIMDQWIPGMDVNAESEADAPAVIVVDKPKMRQAIGKALLEAGVNEPQIGGTLQVTFTGYGVGQNAANPPKTFEAKYWPAQAASGVWGGEQGK